MEFRLPQKIQSRLGLTALRRTETATHRFQQALLALTAVCLFGIALSLPFTEGAIGFEGSIYQSFSTVFWVVLNTGLIAGALTIFLSAYTRRSYWKHALLCIVAFYVLFNLLPLFRGWALYGRGDADVLVHIGITKELLRTNHVPDHDFYPVAHVLLAELRSLGVNLRAGSQLLAALFTPVYLLGVYLLGKRIVGRHREALFVLVASVPLLYAEFHHSFHPAMFSFMLMPAILFLLLSGNRRENSGPYVFLLVPFSIFLVFFHPVTALFLVLALIVSAVVRASSLGTASRSFPALELGLAALVLAVWIGWYLRFDFVLSSLQTVGESLLAPVLDSVGPRETVADDYGVAELERSQSLEQIAVGALNRYGPIFLVCGLAAVTSLRVVVRAYRRDAVQGHVWVTAQFFTGVSIAIVSIFFFVIAHNPIRNSRYMIPMATILAGVFLAWAFPPVDHDWLSVQNVAGVFVLLLLLSAIPISVTNSYQHGEHMTYAEQSGTEWFYDHQAPDTMAVSQGVSYKMETFVRGERDVSGAFSPFGNTTGLPDHFGYRRFSSIGDLPLRTGTYVVTKEYDRNIADQLRDFIADEYVHYTSSDLQRLSRDPAAAKVYSNGGYDIWFTDRVATQSSNRTAK